MIFHRCFPWVQIFLEFVGREGREAAGTCKPRTNCCHNTLNFNEISLHEIFMFVFSHPSPVSGCASHSSALSSAPHVSSLPAFRSGVKRLLPAAREGFCFRGTTVSFLSQAFFVDFSPCTVRTQREKERMLTLYIHSLIRPGLVGVGTL